MKQVMENEGWGMAALVSSSGALRETFTRGVGLAGDIGTIVAVTRHSGSTNPGLYYAQHNHRGDVIATRNGTATAAATGKQTETRLTSPQKHLHAPRICSNGLTAGFLTREARNTRRDFSL